MGWKSNTAFAIVAALAGYAALFAWAPGVEMYGERSGSVSKVPEVDCQYDALYGPWEQSPVAFEHFDSARTHLFRCSSFGGRFDGPNVVIARRIPGEWITPYNWVTNTGGVGFVYGGAYGDFPGADGSFVAAIAPDGRELWRRRLFDASANPDSWNYPGVVGLYRDGSPYAVFGASFVRLDPDTGAVTGSMALPVVVRREDTAYNGFNGFSDGALVMKTVHREEGCDLQGFSAFLRCEGALDVAPSVIAVVDPQAMELRTSLQAPEHMGGRLTTTEWQGRMLLYLTGAKSMVRYIWDGKELLADPDWGPVEFMRDGQTPAPAAAIIGDWVVAQTNALPAKVPLSLVAVSQKDGRMVRVEPFADLPFWAAMPPVRSFLPAMLTVDPENSRIYVMDSGVGLAAAYSLDQTAGEMTLLWRVHQRTLNFSTLVGPPDARVFVATDIGRFCPLLRCLRSYDTEQLVFRDAATGRELARSGPLPHMTSGALVTPVAEGHFRYLGLAGEIYDVSVAPAAD